MRLSVRRTSTRIFRWTDAPVGKRKIPAPSLRRRDFFAVCRGGAAVVCRRRLFAGGGCLQGAGACRGRECLIRPAEWRAGMGRSRERRRGRIGAGMRMRRAAADGERPQTARCRRRGDAGGGEVGQETEWRSGIRSGGRGGLKGTGGGFGWKRRRIREKAARTERRRL